MINVQGKLPREIWIAASGGVDSMAALDFLRRNHFVHVVHFDHGTEHATSARECVQEYCMIHQLPLMVGEMDLAYIKPKRKSQEEWWRDCRYAFFNQFHTVPLITCHHLDDCVETWMFSSINGTGKIIPYKRGHILRPLRLTRKRDLALWADLNNVSYVEDGSNSDLGYARNYIRHEMMPHVLQINPGIHKTIRKKVKEDYTV